MFKKDKNKLSAAQVEAVAKISQNGVFEPLYVLYDLVSNRASTPFRATTDADALRKCVASAQEIQKKTGGNYTAQKWMSENQLRYVGEQDIISGIPVASDSYRVVDTSNTLLTEE